jgi:hypothetical protein
MGYNRDQFEHYRKSRKEERKYDVPLWKTESTYVDRETGEIIIKRQLENGEYIRIKSTTNFKQDEKYKIRSITTECERSKQTRIW